MGAASRRRAEQQSGGQMNPGVGIKLWTGRKNRSHRERTFFEERVTRAGTRSTRRARAEGRRESRSGRPLTPSGERHYLGRLVRALGGDRRFLRQMDRDWPGPS